MNLENTIRERAYQLWELDGKPESDGIKYWLESEKTAWFYRPYDEIDEWYKKMGDIRRASYMKSSKYSWEAE